MAFIGTTHDVISSNIGCCPFKKSSLRLIDGVRIVKNVIYNTLQDQDRKKLSERFCILYSFMNYARCTSHKWTKHPFMDVMSL